MKKYIISDQYIKRDFYGDTVLVPFGTQLFKSNRIIILNESSALLWEALHQEKSYTQLVEVLMSEYETEENVVKDDVSYFLEYLDKIGALKVAEQ